MTETENPIVGKWAKLRLIGKGGQGEVWLVYERVTPTEEQIKNCKRLFKLGKETMESERHQGDNTKSIIEDIWEFANRDVQLGALKSLLPPDQATNAKGARSQMEKEINAIQQVSHPGLLKLFDVGPNLDWYVSEYCPNGNLANQLDRFVGDPLKTLKCIRQLLDGISLLHEKSIIHRDIKPENIFVGNNDRLILGDFGIAYVLDETRNTLTHENKGSRDWMPAWAQGLRLDSVKPTFDVYSIGKVIWSMISGQPKMRL